MLKMSCTQPETEDGTRRASVHSSSVFLFSNNRQAAMCSLPRSESANDLQLDWGRL
jgi:hypothetical protein